MTTASLLGALDQYEVQFVADFMSPFARKIVRATCQYGKEVIALNEKIIFMDPMYHEAFRDDHAGESRLKIVDLDCPEYRGCEVPTLICFNSEYLSACAIEHKWDARVFDGMNIYAAIQGDRDPHIIAKEWREINFVFMEEYEASSASDFDGPIIYAAMQGDRDPYIVAKEWCETNFELMEKYETLKNVMQSFDLLDDARGR